VSEQNIQILLILIVGVIFAFLILSGIKYWRKRDLRFKPGGINMPEHNSVDRDGFDLDGVSKPRPAGYKDESRQEPNFDDELADVHKKAPTEQISMFAEEQHNEESIESEQESFSATESSDESSDPSGEPDIVIILNLMAKTDSLFEGQKMLQAFVENGLKFGEMDIFHKHVGDTARNPVMFSIANAVKPGHFEIDKMKSFTSPGITLFLTIPGPKDMLAAYDSMLSVTQKLASSLDGEILDQSRATFTKQTASHYRDLIVEYKRKRLTEVI
jgi:cell division protein ZipA